MSSIIDIIIFDIQYNYGDSNCHNNHSSRLILKQNSEKLKNM